MDKMQCTVCGHIYDPVKGDVGVTAGTDFEKIPETWCCPVCGAAKRLFRKA